MSENEQHLRTCFGDIPYVYNNCQLLEDLSEIDTGVNCELVAHYTLDYLGIPLPKDLRAAELWSDTEHVFCVTQDDQPLEGDVYFFTRDSCSEITAEQAKRLHLGVLIEPGGMLIAHHFKENQQSHGFETWTLEKFLSQSRYKLAGIGRPIQTNPFIISSGIIDSLCLSHNDGGVA